MNGSAVLLALTVHLSETFRLLHVNDLDEMAQATSAIVGERLLVRTESKLYSMRQSKGG